MGQRAQRHFSASLPAVAHARRFVEATLEAWKIRREDAGLLVTELAANAVIHARSDFTVTLLDDGGRVRIAVYDASPLLPVVRPPDEELERGRGMFIIAAMARAWGCETERSGKQVWVEL